MDWAEELKMSIRKTTARKGRRSKSRDVLKDSTAPPSTSQTNSSALSSTSKSRNSPSTNNELSVDINLDLQQTTSSGNSNNVSSPLGGGILTGDTAGTLSEKKRPPMLRRISGGWADSAGGGKLRSKKGSFEDDRFGTKSVANISPTDDIPIIPDLDDFKDDLFLNEVAEPPSVAAANQMLALKELSSDLLSQNAFSAIEDVDLSILTKCLQSQESLDEPDEVWEWEKLFTDVIAEINAEKPLENKFKKLELKGGIDEAPTSRNIT